MPKLLERISNCLDRHARGKPTRLNMAILLLSLALSMLPACTGGGELSVISQNKTDTTLASGFSSGIYRYDSQDQITVLLFDGPIEKPTQVCTVRLFWKPHAGKTPIDQTATNATVHYVIFAGDQRDHVGVYSGAGFVYPKTKPGKEGLRASVWEVNLRLTDRNDGFKDLLGPSILEGGFTATRDDIGVSKALQSIDAQLRQQLGYPRMVDAAIPPSVTLAR